MNMSADRRHLMARIRTRDTSPEIALRRALHARGLRFRLHRKDLPGSPDIVLPASKLVVFVHGCFWHGCENCDRGRRRPKTNVEFWNTKVAANKARDAAVAEKLIALGWHIVTVWECAIRRLELLAPEADRILLISKGVKSGR